MHNTEVVTTADKDQRDRIYADLRANGDALERQVMRFSSCEPVMLSEDIQAFNQSRGFPNEARPTWRQTWSIAYPRS
jgi:hypothetical protein